MTVKRDLTPSEQWELKFKKEEEERMRKARNRQNIIRKARETRRTTRRIPGTNLLQIEGDLPELAPLQENPDPEDQ